MNNKSQLDRKYNLSRSAAILALSLALAPNVLAGNLSIGASKASAMAGAGLALAGYGDGSNYENPAMLAYDKGFKFYNFDLGLVLSGISLNNLTNSLSGINKGGLSSANLIKLAQEYGSNRVALGALGRIGASFDGLGIGISGSALITTIPNSQLQQWASSGANLNAPVNGMQLDGYGYGYESLNVGYGHTLPAGKASSQSLGVVVHFLQTYYSHQIANESQIVNANGQNLTTPAPEMNGKSALSTKGVGFDLGWHYATGPDQRLQLAAVVNNLIQPKVGYLGTLPNNVTGVTSINPFARSLSFGSGYELKKGAVIALDWVNVGSNFSEVRAGGMIPVGPLRFSGGYGSLTGFTVGIGYGSFNFTYGATDGFRAGTFFRF